MKLSIILLIVGLCLVSAKYLPDEWDSSGQILSRYKRFDLGDSDTSSENDSNSDSKNDDVDDLTNETDMKEQSKRVANLEKMRQKLLEKQEKERQKQEEAQRKIEEKIAKELQKEEEKRQKEKRKWEEKLEKERKKLEEEERKIQEKILENERKRQERIQKEMEKIEGNESEKQKSESNSSNDNDSDEEDSIELEDIWKLHIYSKYGITEDNTNVEKKAALRKYMQEELGLNANSTQSERRQAVLQFIQTELQKVPNVNTLRSQLIDYINYIGVQKIREKLEGDIEKLKNKTETLDNVNLTWVPIAKQNIAEQVSFLQTIKQFLSNLLPNWFDGTDKPQQGLPIANADSIVSPDSNILTQEAKGVNPTNTIDTNSNVSNSLDGIPISSPVSDYNGASVSEPTSIDAENPAIEVGITSETYSQTTSAAETNSATSITENVDSENKQLPTETGSDTVEITKKTINGLDTNGVATVNTKPDTGITNISADTGSTINSDVNGADLIKKPLLATDSVNNVNGDSISPTESQVNPSGAGISAADITNHNMDNNINENIDSVSENVVNVNKDNATENSNDAISGSTSTLISTSSSVVSSLLVPSSDLSEASLLSSNDNNENRDIGSSASNVPDSVNVVPASVDSKNSITITVTELSSTVENGILSSGLPGSDITEVSLTGVTSDNTESSSNRLDVPIIVSAGSNNVNNDVTQNILTNSSKNTTEIEARENPSPSNGIQTQVNTEIVEIITQATIVNESSIVTQDQSNPESINTDQQLINEITTTVTEEILTAETKLQDVSTSLANDLKTDSITEETPINLPVPVEPGAAVIDVAQQ